MYTCHASIRYIFFFSSFPPLFQIFFFFVLSYFLVHVSKFCSNEELSPPPPISIHHHYKTTALPRSSTTSLHHHHHHPHLPSPLLNPKIHPDFLPSLSISHPASPRSPFSSPYRRRLHLMNQNQRSIQKDQ